MKITIISDTHNNHKLITDDLPGGDLLIHAGDISSMGYEHEITEFCKWFDKIDNYDTKVFIAGNHDWGFQNNVKKTSKIVNSYKTIDYLQDELLMVGEDYDKMIKIWGSPWQPEFYNWAFNLPRLGDELKKYWDMIPDDTDVLITHGPPNEARDFVSNWRQGDVNVGCELLRYRVDQIKPLVHVFGHIHGAYGPAYIKDTLFVNASICTEQYIPSNKPIVIDLHEYDGEIVATYVEI